MELNKYVTLVMDNKGKVHKAKIIFNDKWEEQLREGWSKDQIEIVKIEVEDYSSLLLEENRDIQEIVKWTEEEFLEREECAEKDIEIDKDYWEDLKKDLNFYRVQID